METSSARFVDRMIERMPAALQTDLRESAARLLAIRSPKQALRTLESEYEHILRLMLPIVIEYPLLRRPAAAATFTAGFAALAATAVEADELLSLVSAGTLTAPGTSVVVAIGLLAAAAETYAAASVRVHQLRQHQCAIDTGQLASDVRAAVLGDFDAAASGIAMAKRILDGAAGRLTTRWIVGAVPIVGIGYSAFDSARTVRRVLRVPLPPPVESGRNKA
ncbi:MAG: hypothetical protein M3Q30_00075 [Actinomycetota bacterium]|nr:hypothetical protein [Actinomycetota bacterium]